MVVMWGHAADIANCYGHLQRHGSHVEINAGVHPAPPPKHTHSYTPGEGRIQLSHIIEVFERAGQATQEAVKKLQRARKRA